MAQTNYYLVRACSTITQGSVCLILWYIFWHARVSQRAAGTPLLHPVSCPHLVLQGLLQASVSRGALATLRWIKLTSSYEEEFDLSSQGITTSQRQGLFLSLLMVQRWDGKSVGTLGNSLNECFCVCLLPRCLPGKLKITEWNPDINTQT